MKFIQDIFIKYFGFYENWMIWATILLFFCLILLIFFIVKKREDYKKFTTFVKYDVIWKWKYKNGQIISLWCYCPHCQNRLICDDEHSKSESLGGKNTFFICNMCNESEKGRATGGDRNYVLRLIKNEIYRLIKTNKFKDLS